MFKDGTCSEWGAWLGTGKGGLMWSEASGEERMGMGVQALTWGQRWGRGSLPGSQGEAPPW